MKEHVLVVDDEVAIRRALEKLLLSLDYQVTAVDNPVDALKVIASTTIDVALIDLIMPGMDGVELIREIKKGAPEVVSIVMTAFGTISSAVEAIKAGAYHYLTKPFELDDISSLVATAIEHKGLKEENRQLKRQLQSKYHIDNMLGESEPIRAVFEMIDKITDTDSTVLVLGESGTGKEMVARALHYNSRRKERPLVTVNCAALPEELLESELFGYVKGAFTGAHITRPGRFDAAHTGTIFLDEVGDMSPRLQVRLLRVLQERQFEPVGSSQPHQVDVRVIAATHQNLERKVKNGSFREDLYYRLNVIPLVIPPLRERRGDVEILATHFLHHYNRENSRSIEGFTEAAMDKLKGWSWPGNVRELENLVERSVILKSQGWIDVLDLPKFGTNGRAVEEPVEEVSIPEGGLSFRIMVENFENSLIMHALEKTGWNKNKAAALLKLNRTTLVEKIKKKQLNKLELS